MVIRPLGKTGLQTAEIAFGGWAIGGSRHEWAYGPTDDAQSRRAIRTALELGCTLFDTADVYGRGHSECLLGEELASVRSSVLIATKIGFDFYHGETVHNLHPAYLRFALHRSLDRLRTDHVDILQLHNPPRNVLSSPELITTLERLRNQGKARVLGVSAATVDDAIAAVAAGWPEVVQVPYNMLAPEAEFALFPLATSRGVAALCREVLANGLLSGKYDKLHRFAEGDIRALWPHELVEGILRQVETLQPYRRQGESMAQLAIRFALEAPAVSAVICGCKTSAQVRENFATPGRHSTLNLKRTAAAATAVLPCA